MLLTNKLFALVSEIVVSKTHEQTDINRTDAV